MAFSVTSALVWFIAALLCFCTEAIATVGVFLFLGFGCLTAWLVALATDNTTLQILAFGAGSFASLAILKKKLARIFSGRTDHTPSPGTLAGARGVVSEAISGTDEGQVKVAESFWRAVSEGGVSIGQGERVLVVGSTPDDALLLVVRKA